MTIQEEYWKLKRIREMSIQAFAQQYDKDQYHPLLKNLQKKCGEIGHVMRPYPSSWDENEWVCENCGCPMEKINK